VPLTADRRREILAAAAGLADRAMRVLALAWRDIPLEEPLDDDPSAVERDLVHVGLAGMIDPPRDGAMDLCTAIAEAKESNPELQPSRIVYVSCNPSTLARDAGILVNTGGYRLSQAGVVNMFPHTAHVESIAVFDRGF
jgi:hypothetical protein